MTATGKDYGRALHRLISQYSEDFTYEYDSERAAFDDFANNTLGDPRGGALLAIDALLADADDEADLESALHDLSLNYVVTAAGHASFRDFVLMLRGWLAESLAERPDGADS